jgi:hypothetical protein
VPPRKRNKATAADTDEVEEVRFLFILLFWHNANLNETKIAHGSPLGLVWTANYEVYVEQHQTYILAGTGDACVPCIIQVQ